VPNAATNDFATLARTKKSLWRCMIVHSAVLERNDYTRENGVGFITPVEFFARSLGAGV